MRIRNQTSKLPSDTVYTSKSLDPLHFGADLAPSHSQNRVAQTSLLLASLMQLGKVFFFANPESYFGFGVLGWQWQEEEEKEEKV